MSHFLIVCATFYPDIAEALSSAAIDVLRNAGATHEHVQVPGAFEIPAAIRFASASEKFDGYIALGCVIRGETTHYEYVCAESARALMDLSLKGIAIGYGILTVETVEQAWARAGCNQDNKGAGAAQAALRMLEIKRRFGARV